MRDPTISLSYFDHRYFPLCASVMAISGLRLPMMYILSLILVMASVEGATDELVIDNDPLYRARHRWALSDMTDWLQDNE